MARKDAAPEMLDRIEGTDARTGTRLKPSFIACLCAVFVVLPAPGPGQEIQGTVEDRSSGTPVSFASVVLLDTHYSLLDSTSTDGHGRFEFAVPGPGEYSVAVEREGYASTVSRIVELEEDETVLLRLEIDSRSLEQMHEMSEISARLQEVGEAIEASCGDPPEPARAGILLVTVRDTVTGRLLPGLKVSVEWPREAAPERQRQEVRSTTGEGGALLFCRVPASDSVRVTLEELQVDGRSVLTHIRPAAVHPVEIGVAFGDAAGDVLGRVTAYDTGEPVPGAEVKLFDTEHGTVTNQRGIFIFESVPAGAQILEVRHVGYGTQQKAFTIRPGVAHEIEATLVTEAIELEPIVVTVQSRRWFGDMAGLERRMESGFGHFLTRQQFETEGEGLLGDKLYGIPGLKVQRSNSRGGLGVFPRFRRAPPGCSEPEVFVDGVHWTLDGYLGINEFATMDIEAVELYSGAAQVPPEFNQRDAQCGVILIWTRRGR